MRVPVPQLAPMLTVREAAERVSLTQWAIYRAIHRGDLTAYKSGGRLRIREADLNARLESTRVLAIAAAERARRPRPTVVVESARPPRVPAESLRARVRAQRRRGSTA